MKEEHKDSDATISGLKSAVEDFSRERGWQRYQSAKNLAIAISVEAAELLDIFKWKREGWKIDKSGKTRKLVEDEIADILIYVVNFANLTSVDLASAVYRKMAKNAMKYPARQRLKVGNSGSSPQLRPH